MNKLAVVLGVAAVATLAGCKDPEYARNKPGAQNEVKSVVTEPVDNVQSAGGTEADVGGAANYGQAAGGQAADADEINVESIPGGEAADKCQCKPGAKHSKPCECGASDCKCAVTGAAGASAAGVAGAGVVGAAGAADAEGAGAVVAEAGDAYTVYIVQKGDYLAKISKKYNIKIDAIKKLNNMTSDNIRLGQKIKLPGKVEVGAQEIPAGAIKATPKKVYQSYVGATKEYVVVAGDTLGKIAYSNGMNIRQLKELNGLTSDTIRIGQKLKIADGQAAVAVSAPVAAAKTETKAVAKTAAAKVDTKVAEAKADTKAAVAEADAKADAVVSEAEAKVEAVAEAVEGTTNYVVQEGDDLPTIAIEFRVPVARLRELNNLGEGDEVKAGQVLKIPAEQ